MDRADSKDMAARTLLLKLERAGLIQLPKRRGECSASSHANFHQVKAEVATLKAENTANILPDFRGRAVHDFF
jgi:hypothetical protein